MNQDEVRQPAHAKQEAEGRPNSQHDRHPSKAEQKSSQVEVPQTWSADHGGGVSPPTSTGSVNDEQVAKPANDWPAADGETLDAETPDSSSVDNSEIPEGGSLKAVGNGAFDQTR